MLLDLIYHAFAFDLAWFVSLVMGNLFFLFGFAAVAYFITSGRRTGAYTVFISFIMFGSLELLALYHLAIYTAGGLMLLYLSRMAILLFIVNTKRLSGYLPQLFILSWFGVLFFYNIFMV